MTQFIQITTGAYTDEMGQNHVLYGLTDDGRVFVLNHLTGEVECLGDVADWENQKEPA